VVFTGALSRWSRAEAARLVEAAGGEVANGLSRRTTLVVVGERPGATAEEARARGLAVVDEAAFRERVGP
jgi:DNA ligase (NAD+)